MRKARKRESQDFHKLAGILPADTRKQGTYVQVFAYAQGNCLWAGAHYVPEINARAAFHLENHWRRWRCWYDNLPANRTLNYPAKEGPRAADVLCVFPVGKPELAKMYRMP